MTLAVFILMLVASLEAYIMYKQDLEINKLKSRLWDMSGLEPIFWEDNEWDD